MRGSNPGSTSAPTSRRSRFTSWASAVFWSAASASGAFEDLLGLAKVRARSDAALQARPGQPHALLGAGDGVLGDAQQARVRGIGQPGGGDVRDQREPRRASCRLGREIAVALAVGQRSQAAEQVDLEAVIPTPSSISGRDALAVAARIGARARRCVDLRELLRALDPIPAPARRRCLRRRPSGPGCWSAPARSAAAAGDPGRCRDRSPRGASPPSAGGKRRRPAMRRDRRLRARRSAGSIEHAAG